MQGKPRCDAAREYLATLPARFEQQAQTLAHLTGWSIEDIRAEMARHGHEPGTGDKSWIEKLWDR